MATNTEQVKQDVAEDPVISEIRKTLTSEAEKVSSSTSGIEDSINSAISGIKKGAKATENRIESKFGREQAYGLQQGQRNVEAFAESRSGFGTQMAALRNVVGETDNYLKDLASRKEEALLANDSNMYSQIASLEMKGLEMKNDALQRTFQNLVSVSSMGLQARQFELGQAESSRQFNLSYELNGKQFQLAKDVQSFQEKKAMGDIALEFGLNVGEADTIDTLVTKAAATGQVSERKALELEALRAQINASNATAAKALQKDASEKPFDPMTAEILATAYLNGDTSFLGGLKTNEQYASVIDSANKKTETEKSGLQTLANASGSQKEFMDAVTKQTSGMPPAVQARILQSATNVAANTTFATKKTGGPVPSLTGLLKGFPQFSRNIVSSGAEMIIGQDIPGGGFGN